VKDRTFEAVRNQIDAMSVEVFEVGLFQPGGAPEMIPRTWDKGALLKSVPWLKHQNSAGRNIYIRPKGEHPLTLLDDLSAAALKTMKQAGCEPCVVVETSPCNFQAWLNHGRILPKEESTAVAKHLAARFGADPSSADWRHYGRLAGFTNRKDRYRGSDGHYPYVRLIEAQPGLVFSSASSLVAPEPIRSITPAQTSRASPSLLTIDDFRANPVYGGDQHRIDLAYANYALSRGVPEAVVRRAIESRDLTKKGSSARQEAYAARTIAKALAPVPNRGRIWHRSCREL